MRNYSLFPCETHLNTRSQISHFTSALPHPSPSAAGCDYVAGHHAEEGTIVVRRAVRLRARFRIGHHEHGGPAQNSDTSQPDPSTRRCTGGLSPFRPLRRVQPIPCLVHFALRGVPPAILEGGANSGSPILECLCLEHHPPRLECQC